MIFPGTEIERPGRGLCGGQGESVLGHAHPGPGTLHGRTPTFRHHDIQGTHAAVRSEQTRVDRRVSQQRPTGEPQGLGRRCHAVTHRQPVQLAAGHHGRHRGYKGAKGQDENVADRRQGKGL